MHIYLIGCNEENAFFVTNMLRLNELCMISVCLSSFETKKSVALVLHLTFDLIYFIKYLSKTFHTVSTQCTVYTVHAHWHTRLHRAIFSAPLCRWIKLLFIVYHPLAAKDDVKMYILNDENSCTTSYPLVADKIFMLIEFSQWINVVHENLYSYTFVNG